MSTLPYNKVGIVGAGAMGTGIAQVAAISGAQVWVFDTNQQSLDKSQANMQQNLQKLQDKGKISNAATVLSHINYINDMGLLKDCNLVIEAIVENIDIKKNVFVSLEGIVSKECVLASNTSSLSITSIAAACTQADRVIGIHFFNPAAIMPLVEIIPAVQTEPALTSQIYKLINSWGKQPVIAKDTPGFIVNRIARPFYGEAIRIMEEGIATKEEIDYAMTHYGGFKMGPFELMDFIGHDVNYIVTETVYAAFFYDNRYKPSFSQKRLYEAGWNGRKSGKGFYDYSQGDHVKLANMDDKKQQLIAERILFLLINEAVDALYLQVASAPDIELAMMKGVNYPKGLLQWCNDLGTDYVLAGLDHLFDTYREDRYRASVLLRQLGLQHSKINI